MAAAQNHHLSSSSLSLIFPHFLFTYDLKTGSKFLYAYLLYKAREKKRFLYSSQESQEALSLSLNMHKRFLSELKEKGLISTQRTSKGLQIRILESLFPLEGPLCPLELFKQPVSLEAKLCYIRLLHYAGRDGRAFPRVQTLAKALSLSPRSCQRHLKELKEHHLIQTEKKGFKTYFLFVKKREREEEAEEPDSPRLLSSKSSNLSPSESSNLSPSESSNLSPIKNNIFIKNNYSSLKVSFFQESLDHLPQAWRDQTQKTYGWSDEKIKLEFQKFMLYNQAADRSLFFNRKTQSLWLLWCTRGEEYDKRKKRIRTAFQRNKEFPQRPQGFFKKEEAPEDCLQRQEEARKKALERHAPLLERQEPEWKALCQYILKKNPVDFEIYFKEVQYRKLSSKESLIKAPNAFVLRKLQSDFGTYIRLFTEEKGVLHTTFEA